MSNPDIFSDVQLYKNTFNSGLSPDQIIHRRNHNPIKSPIANNISKLSQHDRDFPGIATPAEQPDMPIGLVPGSDVDKNIPIKSIDEAVPSSSDKVSRTDTKTLHDKPKDTPVEIFWSILIVIIASIIVTLFFGLRAVEEERIEMLEQQGISLQISLAVIILSLLIIGWIQYQISISGFKGATLIIFFIGIALILIAHGVLFLQDDFRVTRFFIWFMIFYLAFWSVVVWMYNPYLGLLLGLVTWAHFVNAITLKNNSTCVS